RPGSSRKWGGSLPGQRQLAQRRAHPARRPALRRLDVGEAARSLESGAPRSKGRRQGKPPPAPGPVQRAPLLRLPRERRTGAAGGRVRRLEPPGVRVRWAATADLAERPEPPAQLVEGLSRAEG